MRFRLIKQIRSDLREKLTNRSGGLPNTYEELTDHLMAVDNIRESFTDMGLSVGLTSQGRDDQMVSTNSSQGSESQNLRLNPGNHGGSYQKDNQATGWQAMSEEVSKSGKMNDGMALKGVKEELKPRSEYPRVPTEVWNQPWKDGVCALCESHEHKYSDHFNDLRSGKNKGAIGRAAFMDYDNDHQDSENLFVEIEGFDHPIHISDIGWAIGGKLQPRRVRNLNTDLVELQELTSQNGSAVGDFLLARSGLYLQISTDKNGYTHFFALIKGNDLHSGTSPTADTESVAKFIASLKRTFLYAGPENHVVYVLYPNQSVFQREHGVSMTEPTGFKSQGTAHTFADDGFPACETFNDWQCLMALEQYMQDYNFARMARCEPNRIPPTFTNLHSNLVTVDIPFDLEFDKEKVELRQSLRSHTSSQTTSVQPTRTGQGALHVSASQTTISAKESNSAQAEDNGQIFEVSMILKHCFNFMTGNYEYAVQWKGFGKKDDSYVAESLMNAPDLIKTYKQIHGTSFGLNIVKNLDCCFPLRHNDNRTVKALKELLDVQRMSLEYKTLAVIVSKAGSALLVTPAACQVAVDSTSKWNHCYEEWSEDTSLLQQDILLDHLFSAATTLNHAVLLAQNLDIMMSSLSLSICWSLQFIYQFQMVFGWHLFTQIVQQYLDDGKAAIQQIQQYCISQNSKWKRQANPTETPTDSVPEPLLLAEECFASFDLQDKPVVTIPIPSKSQSLHTQELLVGFAQQCLVQILVKSVISPGLASFDKYINQYRENAPAPTASAIFHCCIICGAFLDALVDWLDNDSLFASKVMLQVVSNPILLLDTGKHGDVFVASQILLGHNVFASVASCLVKEFEAGEVQEVVFELSEIVSDGLSQMAKSQCRHNTGGSLQRSQAH
ncbi:hypothetical protein BDP27DRAFT_1421790 [Rhodocollybia butyracea]|uniref:Chromo domain-containing protein n=1 Tax=Rhodocollybia butyracea TaxID=206335 RepID=A0A9P5PSY7_9AGAR|nr:hypothetical protein BDP27DRAFT_1421790 [Rhodocollybia butyracea]